VEKKKSIQLQKAAIDAKEDSLKDQNKELAEENRRLEDILNQLRKDNVRLKGELATTKNALIGKLSVTVNECKNLRGMNLGGKSADAYVKVRLDKQEYKTKRAPPSLNPKFEQSFELYISDKRSDLEIEVMNWERIRTDKLIGHIFIPLSELTASDGQTTNKTFQIHTDLTKKESLRKVKDEKRESKVEESKDSKHEATKHDAHSEGKGSGEISLTIQFHLGN